MEVDSSYEEIGKNFTNKLFWQIDFACQAWKEMRQPTNTGVVSLVLLFFF